MSLFDSRAELDPVIKKEAEQGGKNISIYLLSCWTEHSLFFNDLQPESCVPLDLYHQRGDISTSQSPACRRSPIHLSFENKLRINLHWGEFPLLYHWSP